MHSAINKEIKEIKLYLSFLNIKCISFSLNVWIINVEMARRSNNTFDPY